MPRPETRKLAREIVRALYELDSLPRNNTPEELLASALNEVFQGRQQQAAHDRATAAAARLHALAEADAQG